MAHNHKPRDLGRDCASGHADIRVRCSATGHSGLTSVIKPAAAFDPTARLVSDGHQLRASGPAPVCPKSDKVFLTVTVTQSGVTASGRWSKHDCTGELQQWHVLLTTAGRQTLKRGKAIGHGNARITKSGRTVVTRRWSRTVTLL